jgi:AraC-like DNA-binding protein
VEQVQALLGREVVDAVLADLRAPESRDLAALLPDFPGIPMFGVASFRPEDGALLLKWHRAGGRGVLVEGVDGPSAGEWMSARTAGERRRAALREAPRMLRLTEPRQVSVFEEIVAAVGRPLRTGALAKSLGLTREHLSREFAAGGAPNLKRVIDLVRVCCAADLLANPGYDVVSVARILRYASPSHLARSTRRIAGVLPAELRRVTPRQVLHRFARGRTRSRV